MKNKLLILFFLLFSFLQAIAQEKIISGSIVDKNTKEKLPGVNVSIKGTTLGTMTDFEGQFKLTIPSQSTTLVISFIGYNTTNLEIGTQTHFNIKLEEDIEQLDEVVVVGYGVAKKSDITGAVASVDTDELTVVATENVEKALQGRVAGVQITSPSDPGAQTKVRIRGIGTINNSDPLYVVDGFPMNDISHLAPTDIASMEVLKDASATAIYGSRGANGVILITSKKGSAQSKPVFTFNAQAGVTNPTNTIEMTNASQYAQLRLEGGGFVEGSDEYVYLKDIYDRGVEGTDWQNEILKNGSFQNYNFGFMGGSESNQYNFSTSYVKNDGIIDHNDLERFFVKLNNTSKLSKRINLSQNIAYTRTNRSLLNKSFDNGSPFVVALWADPISPVYDDEGNYARTEWSNKNNPRRIVDEEEYKRAILNRFVGSLKLDANITKDLVFTSNFGVDYQIASQKKYAPEFYIDPDENRPVSELDEDRNQRTNWVWSNYFNYTKKINKHQFGAMVGGEMQYWEYNNVTATGFDIPHNENLRYLSAAKGSYYNASSNQNISTIASGFTRINYNFDSKYMLTATLRADGSSRFAEGNRWGIFPSFSAGWNIKEENFLKAVDKITALKLRAGWGQVGNQSSAGENDYLAAMTNNQRYVIDGEVMEGRIPTGMSNKDLKWETSEMTNIGLDVDLFDDAVTVSAEFFIKNTVDMIVPMPVPVYVGASPPAANVGSMQNKGFEFTASYRNINHDFKWNIGLNMTTINNTVVELGGLGFIDAGNIGGLGRITRTEVGHAMAYYYGYQTAGIFRTQDEIDNHVGPNGDLLQPNANLGDIKFLDLNNDGELNDDDRTNLGNYIPTFTGSINLGAEYKGFDLNIFFTGAYGASIVNAQKFYIASSKIIMNQTKDYYNNRFHPENNPNGTMHRLTPDDPNNNMRFSDQYIEDGSYIRLQNIQLGYTFNNNLNNKLGIKKFRIYASVDNAFTITGYKGYDPANIGDLKGDPLGQGVDMGTYPTSRIFSSGVNMTF
ncbi:TonB-dependent receptor [Flammeovirga sp. EKP202]|uniref:SusC/RagA family TonB-linked outer membrane protein n=1 Tax=Flammeovirga sp. EKP202 TaxID=2770592 RepID=UPI00165F4EE2|nr:TonB-dependent receptor [Flammeovirga sp. EKP202]MBD0403811.1 TonB-dependent receptor [Flammeovirga sp. EKP202]